MLKPVPKQPFFQSVASALISVLLLGASCDQLAEPALPNQVALIRTLTGPAGWAECVAWSSDGKLVASGNADTTVTIWEAATGRVVATLTSFRGLIHDVAWSPDGKKLATASSEPTNRVRIWDTSTWQMLGAWTPTYGVTSVSWSPDSMRIAVGTDATGDPSGQRLNSYLTVYDTVTAQEINTLPYKSSVGSVSWSPDGNYIAFGTAEQVSEQNFQVIGNVVMVDVHSVANSKLADNLKTLDDPDLVGTSVSWAPDSKHIVISTMHGALGIWDLSTWSMTTTLFGSPQAAGVVAWSSDGQRIAAAASDRIARIWDVQSSKMIATFEHPDHLTDLAWSPDGKMLATSSLDHKVRLWQAP